MTVSPEYQDRLEKLAVELVTEGRFGEEIITSVPVTHMLYGAVVTKWHRPEA